MIELGYFTAQERRLLFKYINKLRGNLRDEISIDDVAKLKSIIKGGVAQGVYRRDKYGINPVIRTLNTAVLLHDNIAPDRNMTIAVLTYNLCRNGFITEAELASSFGDDVVKLVHGLIKISQLYKKQAAVEDMVAEGILDDAREYAVKIITQFMLALGFEEVRIK